MPEPYSPQADLQRLVRQGMANVLVTAALLWAGSALLSNLLSLGGDFIAKALVLFVGAIAWLGLYLPEHLPHRRIGPANQVTLGRLALTAMLGGLLGESSPALAWPAAAIAALILVLDGADGWLARRGGWASAFGARFDMETDALLILLMAALCWQFDKVGAWILLSGMLRYLFVAAGVIWRWLRRALPESRRRKTVCVLQVLSLLTAVTPVVSRPWSAGIAATGLAMVCYSFLVDVVWLWRRADRLHIGVDR